VILIEKWAGLVTNASPYAIPPGASVEQVNLQVIVPGRVTVRSGLQAVTFASSDSTTASIRTAFRYQSGNTEQLIYQDSAGKIYSSVKTGSA
jgi:phosphoribosylformylglycinamidine (FGAM) synthase-like enzyme